MVTPLTEGDLDRGRPPDLTSPHWRCRIVDQATGAVCTGGVGKSAFLNLIYQSPVRARRRDMVMIMVM